MVSRERILEAAARVYARHGFKGATTRAIAIEADVNEVTLFRTFGSKSALLEAVLMRQVDDQPECGLPDDPQHPHEELKEFIQGSLDCIADMRPILIHTMGEIEERAEAREFACRGRQQSHDMITTYLRQLQKKGMADQNVDVNAAAVMLIGTVISDVMGRPIVPDLYPALDRVADEYAKLFLRAIGVGEMIYATEETPAVETDSTRSTVSPYSPQSHTSKNSPA
jgi:AcrR family transcriptional regulator